ncbi:hypothetical protein [Paenibacillus hexagrammi]|uniref:Uncharacterized protein n=1 Tax=Paenibacillus hexagrammi TaxID=2908839 RepID=A0ABY3SSH5_9BACL|nr:hypothetical protein [Paenibacillus sp. YPD9-1]UJF35937.1 hypothetical protein L0M14_13145 [Paenibacillus sp. YPD9-1]
MENSLTQMQTIGSEQLEARIVTVKVLLDSELEYYEVAKDNETGEHYLHFVYMHKHIAGGGEEETFHQLMPIDSDDVLGFIFGEQAYTYPDNWKRSFLRNGPDGFYIWFDPSHEEEHQEDEAIARELMLKLQQFRQGGKIDSDSVRKLLEDLDQT